MGKNDFDIDFDFEEEYGFDPKSFLGTEEYNKTVDLDAFSDEELGLTSRKKEEDAEDTFDLDEDLDMDDFLNMGSQEEEDAQEEEWEEVSDDSDEPAADEVEEVFEEEADEPVYEEQEDLPEETEPEEIEMDENMEYTEEELVAQPEYEEEIAEEQTDFEETAEELDEESEEEKPRRKKERKPIVLPKIKIKTPNIFTKFFDLYFAPVLHKELREEPQDPNAPRRRRRKSKHQIFKEFYLPPIIACVCMVLVLSFVVGTVSNAIARKQIEAKNQQSQLDASVSAAEQAELQNQRIVEEAAALAAGYDYQRASDLLGTINGGDLTAYPEIAAKKAEYETAKSQLVEHKEPSLIPNLSFHVLIADPARAFKDTEYGGSYNKNFVTVDEFTKILTELYNNDYVLVDFDSFAGSNTNLDGNQQYFITPILLPEGKKPVMITETMANYFAYMIDSDSDGFADANGDGFASRLVVDGSGNIKAEYVDAQGQTQIGNYDLVPILEDFIKQHPDFCYQGARATIAFTGHEGVLGYRCNTSYISTKGRDYYDNEVAGAKQITQALRDKGYTLACYTYANQPYGNKSVAEISADLTTWTTEVTNVIGAVDTFVFAKNSNISDYGGNAFNAMYQSGFRKFIAHGSDPYCEVNSTYVRQNRLMVTGENMQWYSSMFTDDGLFNPNSVLDMTSRGNIPKS